MAVPTQLSDLSATAASNSPAGTDTVGTTMDDFLRAHASIIARISAGTDALATPNIGAATGTSIALGGGTALTTTNRTGTGNLVLATSPTITTPTLSGNTAVTGGTLTTRGLTDSATATALTLSGSGANSVTVANSASNPTIGTTAGCLKISTGIIISSSNGITGSTHTVVDSDFLITFNYAGTVTVTMPSAATYTGRLLRMLTYQNQAVVSASSNIVPITLGAAGTSILAATAGKWADLYSDGTNWRIIAAN